MATRSRAAESTPEAAEPDVADGEPDVADGEPDVAGGEPDVADGEPDVAGCSALAAAVADVLVAGMALGLANTCLLASSRLAAGRPRRWALVGPRDGDGRGAREADRPRSTATGKYHNLKWLSR